MGDITATAHSIALRDVTRPVQLILVGGACNRIQKKRLNTSCSIGRDVECDLVLDDPAASRVHARVSRGRTGELELVDLGSRNGVYLNGEAVGEEGCVITAGRAVIRLGDSLLCLTRLEGAHVAAPDDSPLIGGDALSPVRRQISLIAPTDLPVLVRGETGTGKEVVSRMLHQASGRPGPFVPVNCAALPAHLIESELFGHVRGAFTGATQARKGLFSLADGGTLFLDEIGELPLELQAKLLRVLQEKKVRPVGAEREVSVDVRVLSATHRSLHASDTFRSDLLGRLAGVELQLPALRERPEDIPLLARFLLERTGSETAAPVIDSNALEALMIYPWPLNVRELDNALRVAALKALDRQGGSQIVLDDLPSAVQAALREARVRVRVRSAMPDHDDLFQTHESPAFVSPPSEPVSHLSHKTQGDPEETSKPGRPGSGSTTIPSIPINAEMLGDALRRTNGNVKKAAQIVGLSRAHMYRMLKQNGVDPANFRGTSAQAQSVSSQRGTDVALETGRRG